VLLLFGVLAAVWVELTGDEKLLLRRILDEASGALILTCVSIFLSMRLSPHCGSSNTTLSRPENWWTKRRPSPS